MWNVLPLKVHQTSNISNFKKGARDKLLSRYDYIVNLRIFFMILVFKLFIYLFSYLTFLYCIYIFFRWSAFVWGL